MIINPTKKTLPLFSSLPKIKDSNWGKAYSTVNPLFSWHANYYNVNRKKILLLVNDLTMISIVISDVNAQRKKELDSLIREGIQTVLKDAGASKQEIQRYFDLAGEIEINAGFNRQVTGVTTRLIEVLSYDAPIDFSNPLQYHLMTYLSHYGISKLPHFHPQDELKAVLKEGFEVLTVKESDLPVAKKKENPVIDVTWKDFKTWDTGKKLNPWNPGYEKRMEELIENNQLVLTAFEKYLSEDLGLSKKVVNRHVENTLFYINEFLVYRFLRTPTSDFSDTIDYLSDFVPRKMWIDSPAGIQRVGASLKKFFDFLHVANVIDQKQLKDAKEEIVVGVELGSNQLEMMSWKW
ncbi:DUF6933 domain-containing protein [Enterococcus eurekensis]|uniref:DUF6933 domain-containing protein n=1 Tax=Enterococcus eurekensis TaxID=1159753 RepID=A0ABV9M3I2_9ENTE